MLDIHERYKPLLTILHFFFSGVVNPSISRERDCHECKNEIGDGSMAVFAENAGSSVAWHPQCFSCHACKEPLVDLIYFYSSENVYCGRHYAELDGHRCSGCDEVSIYIWRTYEPYI
jgi:hypothetical protein